MSKLSAAYQDCITVGRNTRNGPRYKPTRYTTAIHTKDKHAYWKLVGPVGTQLYLTHEEAEAEAKAIAKRLGCRYISLVRQPDPVDKEDDRVRKLVTQVQREERLIRRSKIYDLLG